MPSAVLVLLFLFVQYGCCGVPRWFNNITGLQARGAGLQCLMRSTPTLNLSYPADPEAHFLEIHKALRPYTQPPQHRPHGDASGFHGPWIENEWITRSRQLLRDACITSTCLMPRRKRLRHLFGPFIPLLLTWVDSWVAGFRYPPGFVDTLLRVLRPNVAYVTVSQNDEGLVGKCELPMARIPNVLVLSSGGYGHVPVPLYHRAETPPPSLLVLKRRGHFVSYVGSADHAPFGLRQSMIKMMHERLGDFGVPVAYYRGPQWRKVMVDSQLSLAPRGWGRSCFHLAETLQLGLVPVYVYSDVPWVPYEALFRRIGYVASFGTLEALLKELHAARNTTRELQQREARVLKFAESHFSARGIMDQIFAFLNGRANDLECNRLPPSTTGAHNRC